MNAIVESSTSKAYLSASTQLSSHLSLTWVQFHPICHHSCAACKTTVCLKNDTALACYNFNVHQSISIIFGRNVAEKTGSQTVIYFPPHLSNASALPGKTRKHRNRIFSLKCCITAFPVLNESLLDFFNLIDFQLILPLL